MAKRRRPSAAADVLNLIAALPTQERFRLTYALADPARLAEMTADRHVFHFVLDLCARLLSGPKRATDDFGDTTAMTVRLDKLRQYADAAEKQKRKPSKTFADEYLAHKKGGKKKDVSIADRMGYKGDSGYAAFKKKKSRCKSAGLL